MKMQILLLTTGILAALNGIASEPSPEAQACNEKIRLAIVAKAEKTCKKNYTDLIWSDKEVDLVGNETTVAFAFKCKEKKQFIGIIKLGDIENLEACELSKPSTSVAKVVPKKPIFKKEKPTQEEEITEAKVQLKEDLRPPKEDKEAEAEAKERPENYETMENSEKTAANEKPATAQSNLKDENSEKLEKTEKTKETKDKKSKKNKKEKSHKAGKAEKKVEKKSDKKSVKVSKAKVDKKKKAKEAKQDKKKDLEPPLEDLPTPTTLSTEPRIESTPTYIDEIPPAATEDLNK